MLSGAIQALIDIAFPKLCVNCKKPGVLLCAQCWPKVQLMYEQLCPVCLRPSIGGLTHPPCRSAWGIDGLTTIVHYRGPIRPLIRQLKYGHATVTTELIEQLLGYYSHHENLTFQPGIITAIPLHKHAYLERGFNQSDLIASVLSQQTTFPYVANILERTISTSSQTKLSKQDRLNNVRGAFSLSTSISKSELKGATIILVDDVFTTGATLREAAKVLKRAGAAKVYGFALAHD